MTRIKKPLEGDFQNILTLFLFIGILLNTLFVFESKALYLITFIFVFFIFLKFTSINLQRILFVFNSLNIFTLIIRIDPFSTSAQNVYYPKILSSLNFGNVSNFWLVEIDDPYPAFSLVNRFLITYFGIDSINILLFILYFLFIFTIYKLCDFINKPNSDLIGFVTSLVFIVLIIGDNIPTSYIISDGIVGNLASQTLGVSNVLLDGLSSYTEFSSRRALIPASFNILILLTIYFFMIKKYLLGFLFGVFISLFHYFSFINLFLVIVSLIFTLLFKKKNKFFYPITFLSIALSTYLASRIFYFLPISKNIIETLEVLYLRKSPEWILKPIVSLGSFTGANIENRYLYFQFDLVERSFIKNFEDVNYINPTPGAFDNYSIFPFEFLIMTIVGFFISKKMKLELLANIIFIGLSVSTVSWFFHAYDILGPIVFLHPYRLSALTSFLSSLVLIIFIVSKFNLNILKYLVFLGLITVLLSPFLNNVYNNEDPDQTFLYQNLSQYTEINSGTVMIPFDKTSWILNSGGISVYSSHLFPYELSYSKEWLYRYELQKAIYESSDCNKLNTFLKKTKENIVLIISTRKDSVSTLQNKCNTRIIIYDN